ncbi:thioredoxin family protein [Joostella atrarenae]|uniref:Thioredoxin family protein n=1 Tax=Joostella atrarenae TaxID=679257 RepID=A0ABS9J582_9FLAO|nr:thioredoxin family protein [Joostella atrarenae]MCF8715586.1 thioredoxin family protein [Joostella atrarenae]
MKINRLYITLIFVAVIAINKVQAQGVSFFEGTYKEALAEAEKRDVPLFIDFYADWCAPCKMMDKNVYVDEKLGAFFNENFVSVKVDVENEINSQLVKENKITSMPTLMFVDANENALSKVSGSLDIDNMFQMAQTVTGDVKSFEEIYEEYQKDDENLEVMAELLSKAPAFVTLQEGINKKKWVVRVDRVFNDYIDVKMTQGDGLVNKEDYVIIKKFHKPEGMNDKIMEYIVDHMEGYLEEVGEPVAFYVIQYNTELAEGLAKNGDKDYMIPLERINGDMKLAYNTIEGNNGNQYELSKTNCDAIYALFKDKDVDKYISLKNQYFKLQGDQLSPMSLARSAQVMYEAGGNNITKEQNEESKKWIIQSLTDTNMPILERVNITSLLGDVYKKLDDYSSAKKAYNQAYIESAQIDRMQLRKYIQMLIKRKIELLKLE